MSAGFDAYFHISIGPLTIETGFDAPHYAPEVTRDMLTQTIRAFTETVEAATALGLVSAVDDEVLSILEDDDDE